MEDFEPGWKTFAAICGLILAVLIGVMSFYVVPAGHVGVIVLGGNVTGQVEDGWGFMNPLSRVVEFDCREKTHFTAQMPMRSKDQLETCVDVSIQYRVIAGQAARMYAETGSVEDVVETHLVPKFRGLARDAGRTVEDSKSFFDETVQDQIVTSIRDGLTPFMADKGIAITDILVRDVNPPDFIEDAIQLREEREQATEQQRAELERFKIEQDQKVAQAEAELKAAESEAAQIRTIAEARAEAMRLTGEALRENPEALQAAFLDRWDGVMPRTMLSDSVGINALIGGGQ